MNLETKRLFLRPIQLHDAADLFAARGDAEVMRYWDWPAQSCVDEVRSIVAGHVAEIESGTVMWWVVALSPRGPAIGECDLSAIDLHHKRAEIGFLFRRDAWGKGYAREAMERVLRYGFEELGLERLQARCHAGNAPSQRLLERLGFSLEGTLRGHVVRDGARRDCILYGRSKS
ncbi:MAG TPA: GNAT family N-acetyltransferase [Rhizomicrobium sp.]|jgi:ribosomal-protein-alanine N-acetyltransferase|nr:GNAT family N-acetyltransferase [Rhizomicrobium sp.]